MRRTQTLAVNGPRTGSALTDLLANLTGLVAAGGLNVGLTGLASLMAVRGYRPGDIVLLDATITGIFAATLALAWWGLPRYASAIASWMCLSAGMRLLWIAYTFLRPYLSASIG